MLTAVTLVRLHLPIDRIIPQRLDTGAVKPFTQAAGTFQGFPATLRGNTIVFLENLHVGIDRDAAPFQRHEVTSGFLFDLQCVPVTIFTADQYRVVLRPVLLHKALQAALAARKGMRILLTPFLNPKKQRFPYITAAAQHVAFRAKRVQLTDQRVKHGGIPYILSLDPFRKGNFLAVLVIAVLLEEPLRILVFFHFAQNHFTYHFLFRVTVLGNKTFLVFIGKGGINDLCMGTFSTSTMGTFNGTTL